MSTGRVYKALLSGAPPRKGRVYGVSLSGTMLPRGRVYKSSLSGAAALRVTATAPVSAGPGEVVTISAALSDGVSADSFHWEQVSGPAVALTGSGGVRSFAAPSAMPPGGVVVIGVSGTASGVTSPLKEVSVSVLPQVSWTFNGTTWVGSRVAPA